MNEIIYGRNTVLEALLAGRTQILSLIISESAAGVKIERIKELAEKKEIKLKKWAKKRLDNICGTTQHQGVVAFVARKISHTLEEVLKQASLKREAPFLLLL